VRWHLRSQLLHRRGGKGDAPCGASSTQPRCRLQSVHHCEARRREESLRRRCCTSAVQLLLVLLLLLPLLLLRLRKLRDRLHDERRRRGMLDRLRFLLLPSGSTLWRLRLRLLGLLERLPLLMCLAWAVRLEPLSRLHAWSASGLRPLARRAAQTAQAG